jgi:hypothetical protein
MSASTTGPWPREPERRPPHGAQRLLAARCYARRAPDLALATTHRLKGRCVDMRAAVEVLALGWSPNSQELS